LLEFKSVGRPYRSGNLDKLWAYLHLYYTGQLSRLKRREELVGILLVAKRTTALLGDVLAQGLVWRELGGGYWEIGGGLFPLYVVEIDVVGAGEEDHVLASFGHAAPTTLEARRWLCEQVGGREMMMALHELEEYDDLTEKLINALGREKVASLLKLEERLAGLGPAERLAGLGPEQVLSAFKPAERLAGLGPDETVMALPDEMLRALSEEYLATLGEEARSKVRERIGR